MAPAWGAAAEVPQKLAKPGTEVLTQSAAVKSGFCSTLPPFVAKRTFPGVIGPPSGS